MKSFITSYNGLFAQRLPGSDAPAIRSIEIPMIQRDYAQGRKGEKVKRIRDNFLDMLCSAVMGGEPVCLDFIYGEVNKDGKFQPLDGQQRLTTLFLLHWYLAYRANPMEQEQGWKQFSYATRASARMFCERLVECRQSPPNVGQLSSWIVDQSWYLYPWRHDPTIQSMLVMLDAINERFVKADCGAAWERLVDTKNPAVSFHLLPMEEMGLSEELYIKMNSRGKPLTDFENFKARFEKMLDDPFPDISGKFADKVDGEWADLLWPYRCGNNIVDEEFMNYFRFVTEVCEWPEDSCEDIVLAERVYGPSNPKAAEHLQFLFDAFDKWIGVNISEVFEGLFVRAPGTLESSNNVKVMLFGQSGKIDIDLFAACCRSYGEMTLQQTLYLYAALLHRLHLSNIQNFPRRLRVLRNLVEASNNEIRQDKMNSLIADVKQIVVKGYLEEVREFNTAQVEEERQKAEFLAKHPDLESVLFKLEDNTLLRGCLASFDLDAGAFERRAGIFERLFSDSACWLALTGAMLAIGDYSRMQGNHRYFHFGSRVNEAPWRMLLTEGRRSDIGPMREVLVRLLDEVDQLGGAPCDCLETIQKRFLDASETNRNFGWRYYLVKYPVMREGNSGLYVGLNGTLGYSLCMLNRKQLNSWYRDPFLLAIYRESGVGGTVRDPWFTGNETLPRWMRFEKSGVGVRCVETGFELEPPANPDFLEAFSRVCDKHNIDADHILLVQQVESEGRLLDMLDRVQLGATFLRDLMDAGL